MSHTTYQVVDGLLNGEEGVRALTCGFGEQQSDGWYYLRPGMPDGKGPYKTKEAAEAAALTCPVTLQDLYTVLATDCFKPISSDDPGYQGVQFDGYVYEHDKDAEVVVVLDVTPEGPHFQIIRTDDNGEQDIWNYRPAITPGFHLINR